VSSPPTNTILGRTTILAAVLTIRQVRVERHERRGIGSVALFQLPDDVPVRIKMEVRPYGVGASVPRKFFAENAFFETTVFVKVD
jgi:hypothetical protein